MVQNWKFPPQAGILCTQSPAGGAVLKAVEIGGGAWVAEVDHWGQAFGSSDLSFSACLLTEMWRSLHLLLLPLTELLLPCFPAMVDTNPSETIVGRNLPWEFLSSGIHKNVMNTLEDAMRWLKFQNMEEQAAKEVRRSPAQKLWDDAGEWVESSDKGQQGEPKSTGLSGDMWYIEKDLEVTMSPGPFLS